MTDLNKQELRRLAHEASETECPWLDRNWLASIMADDWADYVAALNPASVIALLDELAQAKCEAGHAIQQKDAAYSECKALRQDAERYRALREMNWCDGPLAVVADPYSRIKLGSDCPSHERLDQVVDSIMAKAAGADAGVVDYD